MVLIEIEFDERDPLYKCCCGIFHVKTGTRVLSVLNIMLSSFTAFQIFLVPYNWVWSTIQFCESLTNIFSSVLMFIATFTFRPKLVIAYLATQLTILICCVLIFATLMLSIVLPQSVGRFIAENLFEMSFLEDELSGLNEDEARSVIIFLCFCFACFIFGSMMWEIFLLRVSFQCYNYLVDVRDARNGTNRLPPLRLESNTRGVFLVGLENISAFYSNIR